MIIIFSFLFYSQLSLQCWAIEEKRFQDAQELVEKIVTKYHEIIRLTIHAVPSGEKDSRIIACNIKEKIGKISDPEDLEAMKTGKIVVLKEGNNLDVTAPLLDKAGKPIAATGITLSFKNGESEDELVEKAKSVAKELSVAIQNAKKPLW